MPVSQQIEPWVQPLRSFLPSHFGCKLDFAARKANIIGAVGPVDADAGRFATANLDAIVAVAAANANALADAAILIFALSQPSFRSHLMAHTLQHVKQSQPLIFVPFKPRTSILPSSHWRTQMLVVAFVAGDAQISIRARATNIAGHHGTIFQMLVLERPDILVRFTERLTHRNTPVVLKREGEEKHRFFSVAEAVSSIKISREPLTVCPRKATAVYRT